MRLALLVALLSSAGAALLGAQDAPTLTMRLQFPDGAIDEIPNLTSGRPLQIQFLYREQFHTFRMVPRLVARSSRDRVALTVRHDDRVVAELYLVEGQELAQTGTSPSFGVAVVDVEY